MKKYKSLALVMLGAVLLGTFFIIDTHRDAVAHAQSVSVPLTVIETEGFARKDEPVRNTVPLPNNAANSESQLSLRDASGAPVPAQFSIINRWPITNSARWVEVAFIESNLPANSQKTYTLSWQGGGNPSPAQPISLPIQNAGNAIIVSAGPYEYSIDATGGKIFNYAKKNGNFILPNNSTIRRLEIVDSAGALYTSTGASSQATLDVAGPLMALVTTRGNLQGPNGSFRVTYVLRTRIWATGRVEMSLMYEHNNGRSLAVAASARFKSAGLVTDVAIPGQTRTLRLSEHFTDSNYTNENYHLAQDATPSLYDWSVAPGTAVPNSQETSLKNQIDNNYLKIRNSAGTLVHNQGGVSLGNPVGNNLAQGTVGGMSQAGLVQLTNNGTDSFTFGMSDFWEKYPKSYEVSPLATAGNYKLKIGFFPVQNAQNDFIHAQGPIKYETASGSGTYDVYDSTNPNLAYGPDTQNYNFISGKGIMFRFGITLESLTATQAQNFALGIKTPLYALAPGSWYGPSGADALGPLYVEARANWSANPILGSLYGPFADRLDRWGRALYDQASTCINTNPTFFCITLEERLRQGNSQGGTRQHFGIFRAGQIDWQGGSPLNNSYGTNDWAILTALRESDPRGITHIDADMVGIQNIWHYPLSAAQNNTMPRLMIEYQDGYDLGTKDTSPRHGLFEGLALTALIKNDPDMIESMERANWYGAGGYPEVTVQQAIARAPWRPLTQVYSEGVAHRGKIMANLVGAYRMTGDRNYLDIAKQYILYTKPFLDDCETRFGIPWPVSTTNANTAIGGGNEAQCILRYGGDLYAEQQPFMVGYFNDGLVRVLDALKEVDGQYDPVLYPWALHYLNKMYELVIQPYVPTTPNGTAVTPKMIFIYRGSTPPPTSLATSMCAAEQAVFNGTITPTPGGNTPGYLVFCGNISNVNNSLFMPGMAWLYHQTGNQQILSDLLKAERLIFLGSGVNNFGDDVITFRHQNFGAADVKSASELHDSLPMLAAAVLPPGNAVIPAFGGSPPPPPTLPTAPTALSGYEGSVWLTWNDNANNETGYVVERKTGAGSYTAITATPLAVNSATYHDSTTVIGTTYDYRVKAVNTAGSSNYSNVFTITPTGTQSSIGFTIGIQSMANIRIGDSINFTITASAVTGTQSAVTFSTLNLPTGVAVDFTPSACTPLCTSQARITVGANAPLGPTTIVFRATDGNVITNTTMALTINPSLNPIATLPPAPISLIAVPSSNTNINISWTNPTGSNATGLSVERRNGATGPFASIASVSPTTSSYSDNTVTIVSGGSGSGTTYFYQIRATNNSGSSVSAISQATIAFPTFIATVSPSPSLALIAGTTLDATVSLTMQSGFASPITITTLQNTLPTGVTATVNPNQCIPSCTTTITFSALPNAPAASGQVSFTAASAYDTKTININLSVSTAPVAPPTNLTAVATQSNIALTWTAGVSGAPVASYRVERKIPSASAYTTLTSSLTSPAYSDTAIANGATYNYRVIAIDSAGSVSMPSNVVTATVPGGGVGQGVTPVTLSASPTSLSISPGTIGVITVNAQSANSNSQAAWSAAPSINTLSTSLSTTNCAVPCSTQVTVSASPTIASGNYNLSVSVEISNPLTSSVLTAPNIVTLLIPIIVQTVLPTAQVPAAPTGFTANYSNNQITLNWISVSGNVTGYEVYKKISTATVYTRIATLAPTVLTYSDTSVNAASTYNYYIIAKNSVGSSPQSATVTVTTATVTTGNNSGTFSVPQGSGPNTGSSFSAPGATNTATGSGFQPPTSTSGASGGLGAPEFFAVNEPMGPTLARTTSASGATAVIVRWKDNSSSETGYSILRSATANGTLVVVGSISANLGSFIDMTAPHSAAFYKVRAILPVGSVDSKLVSLAALTESSIPASPSSLDVHRFSRNAAGLYALFLRWMDNSIVETSFKLSVKVGTGSYREISTLQGADKTSLYYGGAGIIPGTTYKYKIKSCNASGCSNDSNESTVSIPVETGLNAPNSSGAPESQLPITGVGVRFSFNLSLGQSNSKVKELQVCLNRIGTPIATSGPGSLGNETNYYGPKTFNAVKKVLARFGTQSGNLTDGPRAVMNILCR